MIAIWDDHELANNAYVDGAENHQATCKANEASSAADQDKAGCDSGEGKYTDRMQAATKAYMEWMPIRRGAGTTGMVDTSITQIIEWGDLATTVGLDTRLKVRSKDPTIGLSFWASDVVVLAAVSKNMSKWMESPLVGQFKAAAKVLQDARANESFAQLGSDQRQIMEDAFKASKAAGKPWQIFAAGTMVGPQATPNFAALPDVVGAALKPSAQAIVDGLHNALAFARQCTAGAMFEVPWNSDGFDGFSYERGLILESFKQHTNNPIVLGGDLHDSWAWTLFDGGVAQSGTPVAVNLGAPGVTAPGWGGSLSGMFQSAGSSMWDFIHRSFMAGNPGLKYANTKDKGFFAVKATKTRHVAEFYLISDNASAPASQPYTAKIYKDARTAGRLTAPYYCGTSLVTTAGSKGSLAEQASCEVVFQTGSWPAEWSTIKLPAYTIPTTTAATAAAATTATATTAAAATTTTTKQATSSSKETSAASTTRSSSWRGILAASMLAGVALEVLGFAAEAPNLVSRN
ncbi:unnamed protein product [Polarella glacialis]|uniref:PhoD-like phosphatase metallophosphatase domain-containing protein n=1 Tax=Polarella glacialis TaxID=89957 RepID=A0A813JLA2_POLGL|nr:unnamed protein product [Polarella glacialis]CAE8684289.1 unnamed protein product [Polarella glacialis]